jgi:hypothetical protein
MLQFTPSTSIPSPTPRDDKHYLARLRRIAKRRGLRILKDFSESLVAPKVEPPRALTDLWQVSLNAIDATLARPLPAPKPRVRKPKAIKSVDPAQDVVPVEYGPVESIASVASEPSTEIEVLEQKFDAEAVFEKLKLMSQKRGR